MESFKSYKNILTGVIEQLKSIDSPDFDIGLLMDRVKRKTGNEDSTNIVTQHEDMHYKQEIRRDQVMKSRMNLGSEETSFEVTQETSPTQSNEDEYKISKAKKLSIIDKKDKFQVNSQQRSFQEKIISTKIERNYSKTNQFEDRSFSAFDVPENISFIQAQQRVPHQKLQI